MSTDTTDGTIQVVLATPEHLEDIVRLNAAVQQMHVEHEPEVFKPYEPDAIREFFSSLFQDEAVAVLLAVADGQAAGYAVVRVREKEGHTFGLPRRFAELDQIAVDPAWQGGGFGGALIEKAMDWAREKGCRTMELSVLEFNAKAQMAFQASGFSPYLRRMRARIRDNGD